MSPSGSLGSHGDTGCCPSCAPTTLQPSPRISSRCTTDPVTVYLSVMVRMRSPSVQAVERALYEEGTLLRQHAMRRTLWVATPQTIRRMHAAATRKLAVTEHKRTVQLLQDNGIDDGDAWLCPAKREVLSPGKSYAATQAAHTRVLLGLGFDGALVVAARPDRGSTGSTRGPRRTPCFPAARLPRRAGCGPGCGHQWLRRFGPGTTTDLRWWMGWTVSATRQALADCAAVSVDLDGSQGWVAADDDARSEPTPPWVALLPSLDPTTMGWKQRDWYLPPETGDPYLLLRRCRSRAP